MKVKTMAFTGLLALTFFTAGFTASTQDEWVFETVADDADRFVDSAIYEGDLYAVYRSENGLKLLERSDSIFTGSSWSSESIDDRSSAGSYPSMNVIDGDLSVAYQYSEIGSEELIYTTKSSGWDLENVDDAGGSGVSPGSYIALTSLNDEPVIFYYTAESNRFGYSSVEDGEWFYEQLETDTGWFTSAASCGEKAFVFYRDLNDQSLNIAEFDGSWNSSSIDGGTDGDTALTTDNCKPVKAYHDSNENQVFYSENREKVGESRLSRVSMSDDGKIIAYNTKGVGLVYAEKTENNWNSSIIDESPGAGNYVSVENTGSPHIIYTNQSEIVHATLEEESTTASILYASATVFVLVTLILLLRYRTRN